MNTLVTHEGTYRGFAVESAVGITSTGLPQLVLGLRATKWYDQDEEQWLDWEEYDQGINGYLCLFGKNGQPLKNAGDIMRIFGWDGMSFDDLDDMDLREIEIQFRVSEEEYEGKKRMKVQRIDVADANPAGGIGTVEKLDKDKRSALNKQFAQQLKALSGGKIKTAKAPTTKPASTPKKDDIPAKEDTPQDEVKKSVPPKRPPAAPTQRKSKSKVTVEYDYNSAWDAVEYGAPEDVSDEKITEAWYSSIDKHAHDKNEDDITSQEWTKIVADTINALKA